MIFAKMLSNSVEKEPEESSETDAAWDKEIRERIARYDAGEVRGIPTVEIFAELDRRLRQ